MMWANHAFQGNDGLKELHVGHNFFREKGGELLGPAIGKHIDTDNNMILI